MSDPKSRVVAVGEVMVELARGSDGRFSLACGGDTFNTAVYLARAGVNVAYATALGDDPYSEGILALAIRRRRGDRPDPARPRPAAGPRPDRPRPGRQSGISTIGAKRRPRANCSSFPIGRGSRTACFRRG